MKNYIIKNNATSEYMLEENTYTSVGKFISENEGKKIFMHGMDEEENNLAWVSQYEKSKQYMIPFKLLEEKEIEEKIEIEEIEKEDNFLQIILKNKSIIFGIVFGIIIGIGFSTQNIKTNVQEINAQKVTQVNEPQDMFQVYTDRLIILEKQIDTELKKQGILREEIKKSIEFVKEIKKEQEIIKNKKIELAN